MSFGELNRSTRPSTCVTGRTPAVTLLLLCALSQSAFAQPLDWNAPLTIFGTVDNESRPCLSIAPISGQIRAICLRDERAISAKISADNGLNWSDAADWSVTDGAVIFSAAAADHDFVLVGGAAPGLHLFRFTGGQVDWNNAAITVIAPLREGAPAATDLCAVDSLTVVCWLEQSTSGLVAGLVARSTDRGGHFEREDTAFTFPGIDFSEPQLQLAAAENAAGGVRLILATAIDRPGSVPEQICVFRSDDGGATWQDSVVVDDSAYPQRRPAVAASGQHVLLVYARRTSAAAQRDIFYTYSPDGGGVFAQPNPIADAPADDYAPAIVVDDAGGSFHILYLTGDVQGEFATVMRCSGSLATPWAVGVPQVLSEPGTAVAAGGVTAAAGPTGAAAAWTQRFALGDADILFDASWRGADVPRRDIRPQRTMELGSCFPNPFNATTVLPVTLTRPQQISFAVSDILGRRVITLPPQIFSAGSHEIHMDFGGQAAGTYFITATPLGSQTVQVQLVR